MGRGGAEISQPRSGLTFTGALAVGQIAQAFGAVMIGPNRLTPGQALSALLGQRNRQALIVVWNFSRRVWAQRS